MARPVTCCSHLLLSLSLIVGGAWAQTPPKRGFESKRWEPWSAMRMAAAPILGWKIGLSVSHATLADQIDQADSLSLSYIEGSSNQKLSFEIPKNVDYNLAPGEIGALKDKLFAMAINMVAYRVPTIGPDEESSRKLFAFAKSIGVETIVSEHIPESLPLVDKLANEFEINVAICGDTQLALEQRSKRIGVCAAANALSQWKDRLLVVGLKERDFSEFFHEMYRLEVKPSLITVEPNSLASIDKSLQPILADRVDQISRTTAIRGPDRLTPEERAQIEAALPKQAQVTPKKPRKLLVLDLNIAYGGHRSIPAENFAIEQMGKETGAYEAVFDDNLDNLKYPKIKDFEAIYLNNTVGMIFVDPEVRNGLSRFIREGGGLGGNHGTSHASMDWPEFGEMIGVRRGVHRAPTERFCVKIDDPHSPLTAAFEGKEFVYQDEFFRFPNPPYSRDKLHVLLSMDVAKTDMNQGEAFMPGQIARPDADYAVSWIRSYGKGRVFFCILGHNPTLFTTPALAKYFLAGIQFMLGDLEADTTPSR